MPTRAEVYDAIRNADKAGDSAGVRKLGEYLKTLPEDQAPPPPVAPPIEQPSIAARILGNVGDAGKEYLTSLGTGMADAAQKWTSSFSANPIKNAAGVGEAALNMGTGAVSAPLALAAKMSGNTRPTADIRQDLTYAPRTDMGQAIVEGVGASTKPVNDAMKLGAKGVAAVTPLNEDTAQAAIDTALLYKGGRMGAEALKNKLSPPPSAAQQAAEATARAQSYVRNNTNLDWDSLSAAIQGKITEVAKNAGDLEKLDPQALAREAQLQSLPVPVPATRGQLMRDPVALRNEGNISATAGGAPIREIHLDQNQALLSNLDVLKGKVSGTGKSAATATTPEEAGAVVQGALRSGEKLSKADYKAAYKTADDLAPDAAVSAQPLYDLLEGRPDIQHLGFLQSWLNKAKITKSQTTDGVTVSEQRPVSIGELRDLKQQAGEIMRTGGTEGLYAGKVFEAVQNAIKEHPDVKAAYDVADSKFSAHKIKYEDQAAVSDLVSNASRTDRTTALSNTVKSVTSGVPEEIRQIKKTLLTGGDEATRTAGKQAWREVRAQVIQDIKDRASNGVAINERGEANLTPAALKRAIDSYGPQKLDEIFGPGTHRQIYDILDATRTVKTLPPSAAVGSSTFSNAITFLENAVRKAPGGGLIPDLIRGTAKLKDIGGDSYKAQQATETPLSEAIKNGSSRSKARVGEKGVPPIPLSQLNKDNQQHQELQP